MDNRGVEDAAQITSTCSRTLLAFAFREGKASRIFILSASPPDKLELKAALSLV
jgi:hypothetical protein